MVSNSVKRMRYISEDDSSTSGDETVENYKTQRKNSHKSLSKGGKWLSKNAIMARENRLKKKLYMRNLEKQVVDLKTENGKFSRLMENQSLLIADLRREIKYLKSVIANSSDIGNLIKNIHTSTGMSVTTSLERSLSLNDYVYKPKQPIARKTAHPWEQNYPSYPTPDSDILSVGTESNFNDDLLNGLEFDEILGIPNEFMKTIEEPKNETNLLLEHNYTSSISEEDDDVGVCLHVSKHKVSLEFCSSCSENAEKNGP